MRYLKRWGILFALACLAGCVGPTPYQKWAKNGGYDEFKIDTGTYNVVFYGNQKTSSDTVWYFWMYRCAELTHQLGYDAFALAKQQAAKPVASYPWQPAEKLPDSALSSTGASRGGLSFVSYDGEEGGRLIPVRGGGVVMHSIYIPGGTVTMTQWSAHGIVDMFHVPLPLNVKAALNAQVILDELGPYVSSNGKIPAPARRDVLKKALVGQQPPTI